MPTMVLPPNGVLVQILVISAQHGQQSLLIGREEVSQYMAEGFRQMDHALSQSHILGDFDGFAMKHCFVD